MNPDVSRGFPIWRHAGKKVSFFGLDTENAAFLQQIGLLHACAGYS